MASFANFREGSLLGRRTQKLWLVLSGREKNLEDGARLESTEGAYSARSACIWAMMASSAALKAWFWLMAPSVPSKQSLMNFSKKG